MARIDWWNIKWYIKSGTKDLHSKTNTDFRYAPPLGIKLAGSTDLTSKILMTCQLTIHSPTISIRCRFLPFNSIGLSGGLVENLIES